LRGSVCIYQGEELGLPEADVPYEALRDPYGIAFWPESKGRDGCRTPMPWRDAGHGGFTDGTPWLPLDDRHHRLNVAMQETDPASPLNRFRRFLQWRRQRPAMKWGDIRFLDAPEPLLAIVRSFREETILAVFNLGSDAATLGLPVGAARAFDDHGLPGGRMEHGRILLPGYSAWFGQLDAPLPASQADEMAGTTSGV
jgi:alpha-glucosidase